MNLAGRTPLALQPPAVIRKKLVAATAALPGKFAEAVEDIRLQHANPLDAAGACASAFGTRRLDFSVGHKDLKVLQGWQIGT
jgi:hypothetical protein